jgi:hypothetical protein
MRDPLVSAPSLQRTLDTLEAESWANVSGHGRFSVICFPHSVAVVPQALAVSVWQGMRDLKEG